jgi:hypothetical protein
MHPPVFDTKWPWNNMGAEEIVSSYPPWNKAVNFAEPIVLDNIGILRLF